VIKTPEVSVVIPAYNNGGSLGRAIESALSQNPVSVEVIVVNDGSTDNTASVCEGFGNKIVYFEQENMGQGAARNRALDIARGEFVAFLDADDYWRSGFLDNCVNYLRQHDSVVAVSTAIVVRFANGNEIILPACVQGKNGITQPMVIDNFFKFWAEHDHVRTGSNVIRRSVIDEAGGQRADLRVSQDLEYWGFIATFGKWGFIPIPLWVGNSRETASSSGWLKKYEKRRRLCPTVESWESRILPRLSKDEICAFEVVKGRVAAGYAHNKILGGDLAGARNIVSLYGDIMPENKLTRIIRLGWRLGSPGWRVVCELVRMRERIKALGIA